jgi:hypothetical protein
MALANIAALLAKWGHSVLVVDWDLEAPGVERFFLRSTAGLSEQRLSKPGIVDLITEKAKGKEINWRDCLMEALPFGPSAPVSILSAGQSDEKYISKIQALDFEQLFRETDLGAYIEKLRNEWIAQFEFVLIDSRTGITDIGGICTIHLPDILVLLFTASNPSVEGVLDVLTRARLQQAQLPFDRRRLLSLPVPARDESRTELEKANLWKRVFAERLGEIYKDWLPADKTPEEALEIIRIPYIPYWSFGEPLPVVEEGANDPSTLSFAYQILTRFVAARLDWTSAFAGDVFSPIVTRTPKSWDLRWLNSQRKRATAGLKREGWKGSVEYTFMVTRALVRRQQDDLLMSARRAAIHTFGWPIGVVLDREHMRPRPTADGIFAELKTEHSYDYWVLTRRLEFYTLMSLFEDSRGENVLFTDTQIARTTEALLYCLRLYSNLGVDGSATVKFAIRYTGLKGRQLTTASQTRFWPGNDVNTSADKVGGEVTFALDSLEGQVVDLVEKLCTPLFLVFNFARLTHPVYDEIVDNYRGGKIH